METYSEKDLMNIAAMLKSSDNSNVKIAVELIKNNLFYLKRFHFDLHLVNAFCYDDELNKDLKFLIKKIKTDDEDERKDFKMERRITRLLRAYKLNDFISEISYFISNNNEIFDKLNFNSSFVNAFFKTAEKIFERPVEDQP